MGEYSKLAWGLYSQLLLRTLVTFRHVSGAAGRVLVPDIATDTGAVSDGGLTWTFHLKRGIRFGPPVNREVTSRDIEYAFRRIDTRRLAAQYGFYYDGLIVGMRGPRDRMPRDIAGIDSSNPNTIVFHLQHPAGDFPMRLALPATAPVPHEVAGCVDRLRHHSLRVGYGYELIATGPYMIRGEDRLRLPCRRLRHISGFDPVRDLRLVRNPTYDPATDGPDDRQNFIDGVDIRIDTNTTDIFRRIASGNLDGSIFSTSPKDELRLLRSSSHVAIHLDPGNEVWSIFLNSVWPPFDDPHVRRAVSLVVDRDAMIRAFGHYLPALSTTSIYPWTPSATASSDLALARQEMRRSSYDRDRDGRCDGRHCRVIAIAPSIVPRTLMFDVLQRELRLIGIDLLGRVEGGFGFIEPFNPVFVTFEDTDYPDGDAVAQQLDSSGACPEQRNLAQVGLTRRRAIRCGLARELGASHRLPPNLDATIASCERRASAGRTACWDGFDRTVVHLAPWVPLLISDVLTVAGPRVMHYEFDQFTGMISLTHISLSGH